MAAGPNIETLVPLIQAKAKNLYEAHRHCCSESILQVINSGFNGGLPEEATLSLADGFCGGMGGAGCVCGALSSSIMALGLFLSPHRPDGLGKKAFQAVCRQMHDQFQEKFGSTCCRNLIKEYVDRRRQRRHFCGDLTARTAGLAARLLLDARPDLHAQADLDFLRKLDSKFIGLVKKLF
jgi:C_GCAxxG_C_C family probable redox protein